jgi:hypothetical protein
MFDVASVFAGSAAKETKRTPATVEAVAITKGELQ